MKKFITLVIVASVLSLTSCGGNSEEGACPDSASCADSCKVDSTATTTTVADTIATKVDTTSAE